MTQGLWLAVWEGQRRLGATSGQPLPPRSGRAATRALQSKAVLRCIAGTMRARLQCHHCPLLGIDPTLLGRAGRAAKAADGARLALFARGLAVVEVASTMGAWAGPGEGGGDCGALAGRRWPARRGQQRAPAGWLALPGAAALTPLHGSMLQPKLRLMSCAARARRTCCSRWARWTRRRGASTAAAAGGGDGSGAPAAARWTRLARLQSACWG